MVVGAASRMESIHSNRGIISRTYTLMGRCVASAIDSRFYRKLCTSRHVEKKGSGKSSRRKLRSLGEQATDIMDLVCFSAFWTVLWSTAYLFYRVDCISGLLLLPISLWRRWLPRSIGIFIVSTDRELRS